MEDDDIENYTTVSNPDEEELSEGKIIVLKNRLGKMRKGTQFLVMKYHKVSELEDPELHYMTLLQLHMLWRNEDDLKRDCSTYAEKFGFIKYDLMRNIEKHKAFCGKFDLDNVLDEVLDGVDLDLLDEDEEDDGPSDYGMLKPDLLNLSSDEQGDPSQLSTVPVASSFVEKNHYLQQYFMKCVPC